MAAFYPLAYAAAEIGGARVDVRNLTPAGAEPHDLELSPRTVGELRSADVVVYLGRGFQPAVERAVEGAKGTAVDLLEELSLRPGEGSEASDPHVWLDPLRYAELAKRIGTALGRSSAARVFVARLHGLDRDYRSGLARCERRDLVTSHAAFGYLAARYGLRQVPITGLSPEAEPSPRRLERGVAEVRATGATTVFAETLASRRIAETVARETGARVAVLDPLEGLTEAELDRGETYFSVMRANLAALRRGLGCS